MADNSVLEGIQTGQALTGNVGASFNKGVTDGASWAAQKAQTDMAQQHLEMQQEQHKALMDDYRYKALDGMFQNYADYTKMAPGPAKKVRKQYIVEKNKSILPGGKPFLDDTAIAGMDDEHYAPTLQSLFNSLDDLKDVNVEAHKKLILASYQNGGITDALKEAGIITAQIQAVTLLKQKGENDLAKAKESANSGAGATRKQNADFRQTKAGQDKYDSVVKDVTPSLDLIGKGKHIIEDLRSGKLKATKQVAVDMANNLARLSSGKNNFASGSAEDQQIKSYAGEFANFLSKVGNKPENTLSKENLDQEEKLYNNFAKAYMDIHDRHASQALAGSTELEGNAIKSRAKAMQNRYHKQVPGGWQGTGVTDENGDVVIHPRLNKDDEKSGEMAPINKEHADAIQKKKDEVVADNANAAENDKAVQLIMARKPGPERQQAIKRILDKFPVKRQGEILSALQKAKAGDKTVIGSN